jgi:ABC-type phosphate transport system auxiliary subunit
MIVWLARGMTSFWPRAVVSIFIFTWLVYIAWRENLHYREITMMVTQQFETLRSDHRSMQILMRANTAKFSGAVERNTEAVKKAAKVVEELPDQ